MEPNMPEFILFGDSLTEWSFDEETEGFGQFLEKRYLGKARVVNEGKAGYTSTAIKPNFDRVISRATSPNATKTLLFTIFLGANDACIVMGNKEYVPLPQFEANIREFVETILIQDGMPDTKIVLITPPPIDIDAPLSNDLTKEEMEEQNESDRKRRPYRTYVNKKKYADSIMQIAGAYGETGRVVGLDFWNKMVDAVVEEHGGSERDDTMLPGCGLHGAKEFGKGWFVDGLHLDKKGYNVLSNALFKTITATWPELAPERL